MLVTRVLGDCPNCGGKQRFGNVFIRGNSVLRGCMSCKHRLRVLLPRIRKKIIYLDQFFFSSAFRERDARFVEAAEKILHVSALQLLVAPFSTIHEDETHQWRGYGGKNKEDLMEFIKATSRGHEFEPAYDVESMQIVRAFHAFLGNEPVTFHLKESDAVDSEVHEWDDYFRIDVGRYIGDIELMRDLKQQSVEGLVDLFPGWRQSKTTFDGDVAAELQAAAKGYVDSYLEYALRVAGGDYNALSDSPIMSTVVQALLHCLPEDLSPESRLKKVGEFFQSSHFADVPYRKISASMFATLKEMVRNGAYPNRESALSRLGGYFQDVKHIATYSPYCDAFLVDQPMGAIVTHPHVDLEARYNLRVFSLSNWQEFLDWLGALEQNMTPEHRSGLAEAYP